MPKRNTGKQIVAYVYFSYILTNISLDVLLPEMPPRCRPLIDVTLGSTGEWNSGEKTIFLYYKIVRIKATMKTTYYLNLKKLTTIYYFYSGFAAGYCLLSKS